MAEQQSTLQYTIAASANGRQPEIDVDLVLTYDDTDRSPYDINHGAYLVTQVSGTYTVVTKGVATTYTVRGISPRDHLGDNDNRFYPADGILDKRGITFVVEHPLKHAPKHVIGVNIFNNPRGGNHLQQYSNFQSRTLTSYTVDGGTPSDVAASTQRIKETADCFAEGTLIRTARGDVPVETLRVGDLVVTATGARRPITWLGHRAVDLRSATGMIPVRIAAHAFGPSMPARDLCLSPGHPVLVGADDDNEGGYLVPVMCLINGTTVRRLSMETVTYWHVELDAHDILLAEGLPAESYIEFADRSFFTRGDDSALANPDLVVPGLAGRCRPVAIDGAVVEAERDRLDCVFASRLAQACAWPGAEAVQEF